MASKVYELGVISDTHGRLRAEAIHALEGCDYIFHAGDVCGPLILPQLQEMAPCFAVRGNCDEDDTLPLTVLEEVGGVMVFMHHGHLPVALPHPVPSLIITGHTHQPLVETHEGVVHLNPGSAGPKRFNLPVSVARVTLSNGKVQPRLIRFDVG
jgi:putative phosphoesterase